MNRQIGGSDDTGQCRFCDGHVTDRFHAVFGDEGGVAHRCFGCTAPVASAAAAPSVSASTTARSRSPHSPQTTELRVERGIRQSVSARFSAVCRPPRSHREVSIRSRVGN
ncbi:hypothetical protein EXE46_07370 [Halorubrum sp. GN11_10-6_MGM]|nr:hypothetical protein EXE46_07370 [Halorubrum sp. GN11_10-6_MGM]